MWDRLKKISKCVNDNWYPLTVAFSLLAVFLAWCFFGVSPFQALREMKVKQEQSIKTINDIAYQRRLVKSGLSLGNTLLDESRYKAAENEFKKVLEIDRLNPKATIGILKTEIYKDIHSNFIPVALKKKIDHILSEDPNDPHASVLLGNLYMQMDDFLEAEVHINKALNLENSPPSAHYSRGLLFLKKNDIDHAFVEFKESARRSEFNEIYLNNLAYIHFLKGEIQTAIDIYEKILNLDHEFILPYCEIGLSHRLNGDLGKAIHYFTELDNHLRNKAFVNLDKNKGPWLFNTDPNLNADAICLYDINEKRVYALLSLGATLFINGEEKGAKIPMTSARLIEIDRKAEVLELVKRDLRRLRALRPKYDTPVYEFRTEFQKDLSPDRH